MNSIDNRNYYYAESFQQSRSEFVVITKLINENSSVIDLGCGDGSLLKILQKEKSILATGIELSDSGVNICSKAGLNVLKGRIDEKLPFADNTFDYAICNVTIQMLMYPEILLSEMKRISKYQITTFPNFGFYKNRIEMFFKGRMPQYGLFGYKWYNTGHIHQLSIKDFKKLVKDVGGLTILKNYSLTTKNPIKILLIKIFPNLFQLLPIFLLTKSE